MDVKNLPAVRIDFTDGKPRDWQKFVVVQYKDSERRFNRTFVWSRRRALARNHSDISNELWDALEMRAHVFSKTRTAICVGGGYLEIWYDEKKLFVRGSSVSYGREHNRAKTMQLIKEAYPEYEVAK